MPAYVGYALRWIFLPAAIVVLFIRMVLIGFAIGAQQYCEPDCRTDHDFAVARTMLCVAAAAWLLVLAWHFWARRRRRRAGRAGQR
jgi:hypothetical protein